MNKITTLGNLPNCLQRTVKGIQSMVHTINVRLKEAGQDGDLTFPDFPDIYELESHEEVIKKANELQTKPEVLTDIEKPKDRRGKALSGSGHMRRAFVVAVAMTDPTVEVAIGRRIYRTEIYFAEVPVWQLEEWDRQAKEYKEQQALKQQEDYRTMQAVREVAQRRRNGKALAGR